VRQEVLSRLCSSNSSNSSSSSSSSRKKWLAGAADRCRRLTVSSRLYKATLPAVSVHMSDSRATQNCRRQTQQHQAHSHLLL
jgi:hypothetical protein